MTEVVLREHAAPKFLHDELTATTTNGEQGGTANPVAIDEQAGNHNGITRRRSDERRDGRSRIATSKSISAGQLRPAPKCEAFVMTGEKMLNLNPKISPYYAKLCHDQLPPVIEATCTTAENGATKKRGPFDDFPSLHHRTGRRRGPSAEAEESEHDSEAKTAHLHYTEGLHNAEVLQTAVDQLADGSQAASGEGEEIPHSSGNQFSQDELADEDQEVFNEPASASITQTAEAKDPITSASRVRPLRVGSSLSIRSTELLSNPEAIERLAHRFFALQGGVKLEDVAGFLMRSDLLSESVSLTFMRLFNFAGIRLDAALSQFLQHVCLTGESSQRARILQHFSNRYHDCNPSLFHSPDQIHALTCALILLNTDLHGGNSAKKMSSHEFINNLAHTHYPFDRAMLKMLYSAVKRAPFEYQHRTIVEEQSVGEASGHARNNGSVRLTRASSTKSSTLLINPEEQVVYQHGWLLRKSVYDADGKKTPRGRRGWQMFYGTVGGMVLYLHKDEKGFEGSRHGCFNNCVLLHHSLAEVPRDYTRRPHVFRLKTANFGEQLFQTSEPGELDKWIRAINYVAAAFSTPVLPAPVGSSPETVVFHRPLLPKGPTTLSLADQLASHRERLTEMEDRLAKLRENAPSLKSKGRIVHDYFYKERYLDKERERYAMYASILEEKLSANAQEENKPSAKAVPSNKRLRA